MYFIPDFDDTSGYYSAASGVSVHYRFKRYNTQHYDTVVVLLGWCSRRALQLGSSVAIGRFSERLCQQQPGRRLTRHARHQSCLCKQQGLYDRYPASSLPPYH